MTIDKILVIAIGLAGIIFTYWFFLAKGDKKSPVAEDHSHH